MVNTFTCPSTYLSNFRFSTFIAIFYSIVDVYGQIECFIIIKRFRVEMNGGFRLFEGSYYAIKCFFLNVDTVKSV